VDLVKVTTTHIVRPSLGDPTCPSCGTKLDAATSLECSTPEPGDLTVCAECGAICTFTEVLGCRLLTEEDLSALPTEVREQLESYSLYFKARRN
jgi:hypothetical protein